MIQVEVATVIGGQGVVQQTHVGAIDILQLRRPQRRSCMGDQAGRIVLTMRHPFFRAIVGAAQRLFITQAASPAYLVSICSERTRSSIMDKSFRRSECK